jgi:excisionase family DNA binding protein
MSQNIFIPPELPPQLTLDELAKWLRVSVRTARELSKSGGLPAPARAGRRLLWDAAEVARHLAAARERGGSHVA